MNVRIDHAIRYTVELEGEYAIAIHQTAMIVLTCRALGSSQRAVKSVRTVSVAVHTHPDDPVTWQHHATADLHVINGVTRDGNGCSRT